MNSITDPSELSGKSRAQRIPLDYFRQPNRYDAWRRRLSLLAMLVCGGYAAWALFAPGGKSQFSTGPLSLAHAAIEQDCQLCHQDFSPIASDAWHPEGFDAIRMTAEACLACHPVDGHHTANLNDKGVGVDQACARCHGEHLGRNHNLISVNDRACSQCHADLDAFAKPTEGSTIGGAIDRFTLEAHGDFRSIAGPSASDSGRIAFNHALHLQPGQVVAGRRGGFRIDRIAERDRDRYRKPGADQDQSLVRLACVDCHRFAGSDAGVSVGETELGQNPDPISYDQHCAACHQLSILGQLKNEPAVPHGIVPAGMLETIRSRLRSYELPASDRPRPPTAQTSPDVLIPGSLPDVAGRPLTASPKSIEFRADMLVRQLETQCLLCHEKEDLDPTDDEPLIPRRWLRGGRYDHRAHAEMACVVCHRQADPQGVTLDAAQREAWVSQPIEESNTTVKGAADNQVIMIAGIASCLPCHENSATAPVPPPRELLGNLSVSGPKQCITCHKYHWNRGPRGDQTAGHDLLQSIGSPRKPIPVLFAEGPSP
jgi:hypothetical protein